jgi:hypothetical protein
MNIKLIQRIVCAAVALLCTSPLAASASVTRAQAMSSVAFLSGTWHCTGDGPAEDDTYTFQKNIWRDTDSLGGVTTGTFDPKRQKWVVFFMDRDGNYGVNKAGPAVNNVLHLSFPYPPSMSSHKFLFTKISDARFTLGKQTCVKK